jgi:hypothetical protein
MFILVFNTGALNFTVYLNLNKKGFTKMVGPCIDNNQQRLLYFDSPRTETLGESWTTVYVPDGTTGGGEVR